MAELKSTPIKCGVCKQPYVLGMELRAIKKDEQFIMIVHRWRRPNIAKTQNKDKRTCEEIALEQ